MTTNLFDELEADDGALARLHRRLEHDADTADVLDVAYRTIDTPVGTLLLAATTAGLVRVAYDVEGHDAVLAGLADRISPRVLRAPAPLDSTARQIDEYFAKRRTVFEVPVDLRLAEGFRRNVIEHLRDDRLRPPGKLRHGGRRDRSSPRGAGRRHRLRPQPSACRDPLPPRRAVRRVNGPIRRRPTGQVDTAGP